ncbi:MAG: FAD:protein FMN transferase [Pseudomonadota bacterium]
MGTIQPTPMESAFTGLALLCLALCFTVSPCLAEKITLSGKTMGTFFHVTLISPGDTPPLSLETLINQRLQMVNASMSIFSKTSEISKFNASQADVDIPVSSDFHYVLEQSKLLFELTGGAWDGTVKPLVDLWGFGVRSEPRTLPDKETVAALVKETGFANIHLTGRSVRKTIPSLTLDLGSIAKGYGVDCIAGLLKEYGHTNFIVEIGGEVLTSGEKAKSMPWSVGISRPDKVFAGQTLYKIVTLRDKAMATSGDYRNFVTINGVDYPHIINPATGYPITSGVVSASVISDTCTFADGLATALMVMGPKAGIDLVNRLEGTECLLITQGKDGTLQDFMSSGFGAYLHKE